ncbi:hypothetical protein OnM2_048025 [Erysiphe neolycopersici]|uniref:Uncharacterized protein n=1 Tax=Erysiphe neolycopersici TaxID=212602 RepID=A0A420HTE5_9PEZI|nr:hypothetical protein OnM2_048025 [Erysiphe neolycopersici]
MATITRTPHLFCVNCHVLITNQDQRMAHCAVCSNPNIQSIALIPQPSTYGNDDKGKKIETPPMFWQVNTGQVVNTGQLINAGQLMNAGQKFNCNATKAPSTGNGQKTAGKFGSIRIHGNESVVINNYY